MSEDFTNLLIINRDDTDFELLDLLKDKEQFKNHVMKEFMKLNSSSVTKELSSMKELDLSITKQKKIKF